MIGEQKSEGQDVAVVTTAMTDREESFLRDTMAAALSDPGISQVICVEENNVWIDKTLDTLMNDSRLEIVRLPQET